MNEAARKLRIGTSSWSESSWVGSFYPAGTKPADFLTRYASVFDTVVTTALDGAPQRVIRTELIDTLEKSSVVTRVLSKTTSFEK